MRILTNVVMVSLALAMGVAQAATTSAADVAPTRTQVVEALHSAIVNGQISNGEEPYPTIIASAPGESRSAVEADLAAARTAGALTTGEEQYPPVAAVESTKSRAQVVSELAAAQVAGPRHPIQP
jgi:hypothetical protein